MAKPSKTSRKLTYSKLAKGEIRLLELQPSGGDTPKTPKPLAARVVTRRLSDFSKGHTAQDGKCYMALSYFWGRDGPDYSIKLTGQIQSTEDSGLMIRKNLYDALTGLRHRLETVTIWVDAICIDQRNMDELRDQVPAMGEIYKSAKKVCAWLGPGSTESKNVMKLVRKIKNSKSFQVVPKGVGKEGHWRGLIELLKSKWFCRRWIVQEVALAQTVTLHCGRHELD